MNNTVLVKNTRHHALKTMREVGRMTIARRETSILVADNRSRHIWTVALVTYSLREGYLEQIISQTNILSGNIMNRVLYYFISNRILIQTVSLLSNLYSFAQNCKTRKPRRVLMNGLSLLNNLGI